MALAASFFVFSIRLVRAQEQAAPSAPSSQQQTSAATENHAPENHGTAGTLVEETREAAGDDEEENANLKHSSPVRWIAKKTGLTVHQAHLLSTTLNFAIVVVVLVWAFRKFVPTMLRSRNASIQQALQEARAASEDANRRLGDIENRLGQLDKEIGRMTATAESEAAAEESRIQKAAEEEIRKVVASAEQEIATAAKLARRDLANHTAGLAIALARKQINVDANTDQVLVRNFASKLSTNSGDGGKGGQ